MEGRVLRLIRPGSDRWKIYDIALKRLKEGAEARQKRTRRQRGRVSQAP